LTTAKMHYIMIIGGLEVFVGDDSRTMSSSFRHPFSIAKGNTNKNYTISQGNLIELI
jgi:hypothetical protein